MNGWTPEEINSLEARAAGLKSIWLISNFLWKETGINYLKCLVWARYVKTKYDQPQEGPYRNRPRGLSDKDRD